MAVHYPADHEVFAIVKTEDERCRPKDAGLINYIGDKIGEDFIATAESDKTLYVMRDLEQMIGREIVWVCGPTFEEVVRKRKALPNRQMRFCTTEMKIIPIFEYCRNFVDDVVMMRLGIRYDELERADSQNKTIHTIVGRLPDGRNKWDYIYWRDLEYPLIDKKVFHSDVARWALSTNLIFPPDSNCVGCFWKDIQQIRKNWEDEPDKMRWFADMEEKTGRRFQKEFTYSQAAEIGLQSEFNFGTGSGCQAGFCTD
jgi:3'-phosphoadenosine 5'-phosphosulfate sulfotransferase (PAPS reductase)/FAD synthetase